MPRSVKKGPWIDKGIRKMVERVRAGGQRPQVIQDLVATFDDYARDGWFDVRRA